MKFKVSKGHKTIPIYEPEELQKLVGDSVSYYADEVKRLQTEVTKTKEQVRSELYNEFEYRIKYLENQLRFSVAVLNSEKELKEYINFSKEHSECRSMTKQTEWHKPIIRQVGTGIGTCTEIQCPICKEKKDITDIDVW